MVRVLVSVAALSLSCSLLREVASQAMGPPTATFGGETVEGAALDQATLNLSFVVTNPNPVAVSLTGAQVTLSVDGKPVEVRAPEIGLRVPASGRATLAVRSSAASVAFDGSVAAGSLSLPLKWTQTVALTR